jgi:hypothetical protein
MDSPDIKKLAFDLNNLTNKELGSIQNELHYNKSLKLIQFIHTEFTIRQLKYIVKGLKKNTTIDTIDIIYSIIGGEEIKYLLDNIRQNKYIHTLIFYWNNFYEDEQYQNDFIKQLSEGLLFNKYIQNIYINICGINSINIKYINNIFKYNKIIQVMYLDYKDMGNLIDKIKK